MLTTQPAQRCLRCDGKGCDDCDGLGAIFHTVVLRGHWRCEGEEVVIEGYPPVTLNIELPGGETVLFVRLSQTEPPHWFIKEDGKQVYQAAGELL